MKGATFRGREKVHMKAADEEKKHLAALHPEDLNPSVHLCVMNVICSLKIRHDETLKTPNNSDVFLLLADDLLPKTN